MKDVRTNFVGALVAMLLAGACDSGSKDESPAQSTSAQMQPQPGERPSVPQQPVLELLSIQCIRGPEPGSPMADPNDFTCSGEVKNISENAIPTARVLIKLFNSDRRQIDQDGVRIKVLPLESGQRSRFELVLYSAPSGVAFYEVAFADFYDNPIPAQNERGERLPARVQHQKP